MISQESCKNLLKSIKNIGSKMFQELERLISEVSCKNL